MPTGTVTSFSLSNGYGFITPDEGGADCFVHITAVEAAGLQSLRSGTRFAYRILKARNGKLSAIDLEPLS